MCIRYILAILDVKIILSLKVKSSLTSDMLLLRRGLLWTGCLLDIYGEFLFSLVLVHWSGRIMHLVAVDVVARSPRRIPGRSRGVAVSKATHGAQLGIYMTDRVCYRYGACDRGNEIVYVVVYIQIGSYYVTSHERLRTVSNSDIRR
jgi:hypothetical protein